MSASNTDTGDTTTTTNSVLIDGTTNSASGGVMDIGTTLEKNLELAPSQPPREALITTAINFLQNAKVRHTTLMQKQQFLRSKGLTMEEIQIACERAGVFTQDPTQPPQATVINMDISSQTQTRQLALQPRQSAFYRIKEILHSVALFSGFAYAIYMFWKKFVEPFLFGSKKKRKSIDDILQDVTTKVENRMTEVGRELTQFKETLQQQQVEQNQQLNHEFKNFRSDLEAIKGLLLNRKQFASPLTTSSAPQIPAWQLAGTSGAGASTSHHLHHCHRDERNSQSDDNEKHDDAGSGSGSSETEVVTKNSDSSLEIM